VKLEVHRRLTASLLAAFVGVTFATAEPAQSLSRFSLADSLHRLELPFDLTGFLEARAGRRFRDDPYEEVQSLGESRLQLDAEGELGPVTAQLTADFLYDAVYDPHTIHLESGTGWIDLREAHLTFSPLDFADVRIGRQILTWGTGDMVFINDLFPKDWNAFFIGRDEEYLKAPSDAVKLSLFSEIANLNIVYTPRFDSDRYVDNRRLSYWNPMLGRRFGDDMTVPIDKPDAWGDDSELALRVYRNIGSTEAALYAYRGFWKNPLGSNPATGSAIFPDLLAWGGSLRGNVGPGIGNVELGYYDSRDDRTGEDVFVPNSQFRFLLGYEQELAKDFTGAIQYYLEYMMDHGNYVRAVRNAMPGAPEDDKDRHVITVRLTKLLMSQNLQISLFVYYSPSDSDAYLRPRIHYKVSDTWSAEIGGNVFIGDESHTFFNQFNHDSNIYAGFRYSF